MRSSACFQFVSGSLQSRSKCCDARPQLVHHCSTVHLLRPHRGFSTKDLLLSEPFTPSVSVVLPRTVVIHNLPAFVRRAPVVSFSNPGGISTVEVPGVVVAEDHLEVLLDQLLDNRVVALGPDLDDVVVLGQELLNMPLLGEAVCPQNQWELLSIRIINLLCRLLLETFPKGEELLFGSRLSSLPQDIPDLLGRVPAIQVHLVSSHVEHVGVEQLKEILVELSKGGVDMRVDRVELAARRFDTIILPGLLVDAHSQLSLSLGLSKLPSVADMSRGIKLREDSHTPETCVFHDVPDVLWCVNLSRTVRSVHRELGNSSGVEWEAVGVGDMPMEHVELVIRHPRDDLFDNLL